MANLKLQWGLFEMYNPNQTDTFEEMCRRLFFREYLKRSERPHTDHNTPGIEVLPIFEPEHEDGKPQRRISFQAKYVSLPEYGYTQFKKSAKTTAKKYKGKLDLVYLFCNKTLTTTTAQYKEIERIHAEAGIETKLITGPDLLDMIADYNDIAEYYFSRNSVPDTLSRGLAFSHGIIVDSVTGNITITAEAFDKKPENKRLLKELVTDKLVECKQYALDFDLNGLKTEIDRLILLGIDELEEAGIVYFYETLLLLRDGKDATDALGKCSKEYRNEVEWLRSYYEKAERINADELCKHLPVTQLFVIDRLFKPSGWNIIVDLYEEAKGIINPEIKKQFAFHYGLSLMNLQRNDKAARVLNSLYEETLEQRMNFYATLAEIRVENNLFQSGLAGNFEKLRSLLQKLESFSKIPQYNQQELFVAVHIIESYYHLGTEEKEYLDKAIDFVNELAEGIKSHPAIRYYLALCFELNGKKEEAENIYASLEWRSNESIAIRYLICLRLNDKAHEAIQVYENLDASIKTVETEALYLFALEKTDSSLYLVKLHEACDKYNANLSALLTISYFIEDKKCAKGIILPPLERAIEKGDISALPTYQQAELLTLLAHIGEVESLRDILFAMENVGQINNFTLREIYKSLVVICNDRRVFTEGKFELSKKAKAVEQIAEAFLKANTQRKLFLQIKAFCVNTKKMPYSMLQCSKELFELTKDITWAKNIVGLLIERNESNIDQYKPYIDVLKEIDVPEYCMAVAMAYLLCGQDKEAESFAYKAIYLLNGEDDFNIYRLYFGFGNYKYQWIHEESKFSKENKVLTLEDDNGKRIVICLDSESDYTYSDNKSMGLLHTNPSETDYLKLKRASINQRINIKRNTYTVKEIIPRFQQCMGFVFGKMQENPEKFPGVFISISTDHPEEAVEEIKKIADRSEQAEQLLQSYHFKNNPGGLPIECVGFNDYEKYIDTMRFLLFADNQALYTGETILDDYNNSKYVISLSTLTLLSILGMIECLDEIKDKIIIPESFIPFFEERYDRALIDQQHNVKTLSFPMGRPLVQDNDESLSDIWEKCIDFCKGCKTETITDAERIEIVICENVTGERLVSAFNLDPIQLDAVILAKKENALYFADDLFFRKVANSVQVKNYNFASLLTHYSNRDYRESILLKLSRTNYIYVPFLVQSDDLVQEFYTNLMNGEIKEALYGPRLRFFFDVREKVYRQIFGDDLIDQLLSEVEEDTQIESQDKEKNFWADGK